MADGDTSVMVVGPPGSGKTTRVLAPAILTAPGPVLSTSVKSDLAQMTTAPRALIGRVSVIDPAGVSTAVAQTTTARKHGEAKAARARAVSDCRAAWTPLQAARTAEAAEVTAHLLVTASAEVVQEGGGGARFWDSSAESLLTVLLWLATRVPGSTMQTVGELLAAVQRVADTSPEPELDGVFGAPDDPSHQPGAPRNPRRPRRPRTHAGRWRVADRGSSAAGAGWAIRPG
ncbi:type IV secretory system conjugative DNA transfer family protein [Corynebacterium silvaticum]|uniref:Type IV secretory system conjugative DNA transfer family protein n=1 Tax=Corynebacterium silvaticum TaxID=2320431 RepID=A0A7U5HLB7_9CORY|nr:type IV secretory system conjugative DNA transfer family protein [Corynebacterium silvaticum]ARU45888.2 type IV secretory system conjugative DNA transfer family protein [Corynebacterium silvaticum]